MNIDIFDFDLNDDRIAIYPNPERDKCKMLFMNKNEGSLKDYIFNDINNILDNNDVLVLNNTSVVPARIFGTDNNGKSYDFLLIENINSGQWKTITSGIKNIKIGFEFVFKSNNKLISAKVIDKINTDFIILDFGLNITNNEIFSIGKMPLPPYIAKKRDITKQDEDWYQTVYATESGSIASPTAGLHFTHDILDALKNKGVTIVYLTLHVSIGTFNPIRTNIIEEHEMSKEKYIISEEAATTLNSAIDSKKRIIAVGTTMTRTLESAFENGIIHSGIGFTDLYIYPGYNFKVVNGLLTNFHTPKSTPYLLVSAFTDLKKIQHAYQYAIDNNYFFYSYGDAMLIL